MYGLGRLVSAFETYWRGLIASAEYGWSPTGRSLDKHMPAHLFLALEECDIADKVQQRAGIKSVRKALDDFDVAWENLKSVYGETRFFSDPPNYVKGKYTNVWPDIPYLAAQRNDLSWLIMPEERYHQRVRDWLATNGD